MIRYGIAGTLVGAVVSVAFSLLWSALLPPEASIGLSVLTGMVLGVLGALLGMEWGARRT